MQRKIDPRKMFWNGAEGTYHLIQNWKWIYSDYVMVKIV